MMDVLLTICMELSSGDVKRECVSAAGQCSLPPGDEYSNDPQVCLKRVLKIVKTKRCRNETTKSNSR